MLLDAGIVATVKPNLIVISVILLPKFDMIGYLHKREPSHRKESRKECEGVNSAESRLLSPRQVDHVARPGGAGDQEDWGKRTQLEVTKQ